MSSEAVRVLAGKIERTISAEGKWCRNCNHCSNREVIEPSCSRYQMSLRGKLKINRFCSVLRAADGDCGPGARGYQLYQPPTSIPDAPKETHGPV